MRVYAINRFPLRNRVRRDQPEIFDPAQDLRALQPIIAPRRPDQPYPDATGRPRLSIRTTNGTTRERAESHNIPPVATSAIKPETSAIVRQFLRA